MFHRPADVALRHVSRAELADAPAGHPSHPAVQEYGVPVTTELCPGGEDRPVDRDNVAEYVEKYVDHVLNTSIETSFDAFATAFHALIAPETLHAFDADEIELLVCGNKHVDFAKLEASAQYDGHFHRNHPTIKAFWAVVHSLEPLQHRQLLRFATGSDRVPMDGLASTVLTITSTGQDEHHLLEARTCFNTLVMPEYPTEAVVRQRVITALQNCEGFGLM